MIDTKTSNPITERPKAILLLVITALMWSLGGLLIKLVSSNPFVISGTRSAISAVVLFIALGKPKINWSFAQVSAALAYAATVTTFVIATKLTTAANAILLQYTAPIYVAILGTWLLKEKTRLLDWIMILLVMGGMTLFFLDNLNTGSFLGNVIGITSGLSFGLFTIFMRMQKDGSPLESVFLGNILTALIGLPFLFQSVPDASDWLYLALLGVVQLGIPYILYSKAIKHATALEAIIIPVIEPILNPVWVFLMLGEIPGTMALTGGVIVLIVITVRCVLPVLQAKTSSLKKSKSF